MMLSITSYSLYPMPYWATIITDSKPGSRARISKKIKETRLCFWLCFTILQKSKKGWGEDEPDEESHTPLPPPMKIFDNDPTQDEMVRPLLLYQFAV